MKFDAEAFIKERGLVTDKKEAIELLIETNKAWDVIEPSLQADPDVIMFYQPSAEKVTQNEEDVGVILTTTTGYTDYKFHRPLEGEIPGLKSYWYHVVVPSIKFPEGFDFDKYFEIQGEMQKNTTRAPEDFHEEWWYYSTEIGVSQDDWGHDPGEAGIFLYDREVLRRYAEEILGTRQP